MYLQALDCKTQQVLASSHIQVLVGGATKLPTVTLTNLTQVNHGA